MTCKSSIQHNSVESIQIIVTCKKLIEHNWIKVEVLKRYYSIASVKEIARKQKQLVCTSESQYKQNKTKRLQKDFTGSLWNVF